MEGSRWFLVWAKAHLFSSWTSRRAPSQTSSPLLCSSWWQSSSPLLCPSWSRSSLSSSCSHDPLIDFHGFANLLGTRGSLLASLWKMESHIRKKNSNNNTTECLASEIRNSGWYLDGSLLVRAFLSILVIEVVGGRRLYWFQNCSVEQEWKGEKGEKEEEEEKEEGTLEEDSDDGEEDAEEGVEQPLETDEALDLKVVKGFTFWTLLWRPLKISMKTKLKSRDNLNEKLDSLPFSLPPR